MLEVYCEKCDKKFYSETDLEIHQSQHVLEDLAAQGNDVFKKVLLGIDATVSQLIIANVLRIAGQNPGQKYEWALGEYFKLYKIVSDGFGNASVSYPVPRDA